MRILIDIGHPAHVHLYRNLYFYLKDSGHKLFVTVKNNLGSAKELLSYYRIPYLTIGSKSDNIVAKAIRQIGYDLKLFKLINKYNINLGIGTSINLAHASKLTNMKSILLDDDDDSVQPLFTNFAHPFCDHLLSPIALEGNRRKNKTIYYPGYHELAYLHPNRFNPDPSVLKDVGVNFGDPYFILRFNSFKAHHDIGVIGLSYENKIKLIKMLEPYVKIFITTERKISPKFKKYQISIPPHKIHSFLYYAKMFIGDSQTMTSEAAVLGTPSIKLNSFAGELSVPNELENKYGLCYSFLPGNEKEMYSKIKHLLSNRHLNIQWRNRRLKMLEDKIDVTSFITWFVESYPKSVSIIKNSPEKYRKFR